MKTKCAALYMAVLLDIPIAAPEITSSVIRGYTELVSPQSQPWYISAQQDLHLNGDQGMNRFLGPSSAAEVEVNFVGTYTNMERYVPIRSLIVQLAIVSNTGDADPVSCSGAEIRCVCCCDWGTKPPALSRLGVHEAVVNSSTCNEYWAQSHIHGKSIHHLRMTIVWLDRVQTAVDVSMESLNSTAGE